MLRETAPITRAFAFSKQTHRCFAGFKTALPLSDLYPSDADHAVHVKGTSCFSAGPGFITPSARFK